MQTENSLGTFLTNSFGDRYLYGVNRNAFNSIGSDSLYSSTYGDKLSTEYQFNLIIGTDSGILPNYIIKKGIPAGSRFLFIELPQVIDALRREQVLNHLPPEICVTSLESWASKAEGYQLSEYIFHNSVYVHESIASSDANLLEYRNLSWTLNLEFKARFYKILTGINCTQFMLRQLENLPENRVGFADTLAGAFAGRTAVILAGGPSLIGALPWVRENRDRLLVISVSRISKILLDAGVLPHIIATVDPQKVSFDVSREMLLFAETAQAPVLVNSNHASPLLVGQWGGKSVYTGALFPWETPLNTDTNFYTGPTVSNYALSFALHMGCSTIVLAGVDLCFSREGQTHAEGSNENKVGPNLGQFSPRIETYGGWETDTNEEYAHALHVLGVQAQLAAPKGARIYNCSMGAAKVPSIEYKPLHEIEVPDCASTASETINKLIPDPNHKDLLTHYRRMVKELERARRKFQEILALSQEALACCDGMFGKNGKKRDFRHKIRMDKIEGKLDKDYAGFSLLVKQFGLKKFLSILKNPKEKEQWSDDQIEKATREYYEAYLGGTEELISVTDKAIQRMESRIEEGKAACDVQKLISQWQRDEQFGRVHIWRNRNPESAQQLSDRDAVANMELQYTRVMTEEGRSLIEVLEKEQDVKHTRSKALLLYTRKEIKELEVIAKGLTGHPDQVKALPYLHFINGLLAELRNEPSEAVACYQNLFTDPPHPLSEDALLQVATLSMAANDTDNALIAVECLVGISPTYLPPYGELLKALGHYEDAFNAYNRYLAIAPEDVSTLVSLGIICKDAGLNDMAAELFRRVLDKDQHNGAAQTLLAAMDAA